MEGSKQSCASIPPSTLPHVSQQSPASPGRNLLPSWHYPPPASATQPDLLVGTQQEWLSTSPAILAQPHTSLC